MHPLDFPACRRETSACASLVITTTTTTTTGTYPVRVFVRG